MEDNIFYFNDRLAPQEQCSQVCKALYDDYYVALEQEISTTFPDRQDLSDKLEAIERIRKSVEKIKWMARYGCAIVVQSLDVLSWRITVVSLQGWKNWIHASIYKRESTAIPDILCPAILEIGPVSKALYSTVEEKFDELMEKAQSEPTRQKHHKTPTFVWARLLDAMVLAKALSRDMVKAMRESYQGGSDDVGQHTSCLPRNTSFPLVASVYSAMLQLDECDSEHNACKKTLCVYYLHHLR